MFRFPFISMKLQYSIRTEQIEETKSGYRKKKFLIKLIQMRAYFIQEKNSLSFYVCLLKKKKKILKFQFTLSNRIPKTFYMIFMTYYKPQTQTYDWMQIELIKKKLASAWFPTLIFVQFIRDNNSNNNVIYLGLIAIILHIYLYVLPTFARALSK